MSEMYDIKLTLLKIPSLENLRRAVESMKRDEDIISNVDDINLQVYENGYIDLRVEPGYTTFPEVGEYIAKHLTKEGIVGYIDMFCIGCGMAWYIKTNGNGDYTTGRILRDDGSKISWAEVPWKEEEEEMSM